MVTDGNFGGGGVLPPSPEDYRRMWEEKSKQLKPNEYERQRQANEQEARKKVFQERVQEAVKVRDGRLETLFHDSINIEEGR